MLSLLGSSLANIFFGYCEEKLFSETQGLQYTLDMSKTLLPSLITNLTNQFLITLNYLHLSLKFTFEKGKNQCLPFLGVCVERRNIYWLRNQGIQETYFYWLVFASKVVESP